MTRVVGGKEAKRGSYPWIVALAYNMSDYIEYLCAGSLVSSTYVVTAGHCKKPNLVYVRLGAHNLADDYEAGAVNIEIKRFVQHWNFRILSVELISDIALIELKTPAPQTKMIDLICLPESASFLSQEFIGMNPFIAGWGATKYEGYVSDRLYDTQVRIVNRTSCELGYKSVSNNIEINDNLICAGSTNTDACQGDSGGPLMLPQMDDKGNYHFYLLGVVSFGYECANPKFPGVYTRIASYMPWIKRNMI